MAEIRNHAQYVFKTIAFEVNITSNEYLLGHALRKGDFQRALQLDALLKLGAPIILATDDDGIWPIDNCLQNCPSHHSLSGEYCRAISSRIIQETEVLEKMFKDIKIFSFYTDQNMSLMPIADLILPNDIKAFTVVIHPDIIKFIMIRCQKRNQMKGKFYDAFKKIYPIKSTEETNDRPLPNEVLKAWKQTCLNLAPIAYVSYCAENPEINPDLSEEMQEQYNIIFDKPPDVQNILEEWKMFISNLSNKI